MDKKAKTELPRHIIYDWNGTLSDDVQAAVNAVNMLLAERGLRTVDVARHREMFGFPVRDYYVALGFRLENEDWDLLARRFNDAFHSDPTSRLFRGTVRTLTRLAEANIGMSVLSACEQGMLDESLRRAGIRDFFAAVSGLRHRGADSKLENAAKLFARIAQPPETVWIIGDTDHDKEVADALGCRCLLLSAGYQTRERLTATGAPVLTDIAEVPDWFGV